RVLPRKDAKNAKGDSRSAVSLSSLGSIVAVQLQRCCAAEKLGTSCATFGFKKEVLKKGAVRAVTRDNHAQSLSDHLGGVLQFARFRSREFRVAFSLPKAEPRFEVTFLQS